MSLSPSASWLIPADPLRAMEGGANLALRARSQDLSEESTADRLKLAYDQLAQNERHQAMALQQQMAIRDAANQLRQQDLMERSRFHEDEVAQRDRAAQLLSDYRSGELTERGRHDLAMEGTAKQPKFMNVGGSLVKISDGVPETVIPKRDELSPADKLRRSLLLSDYHAAMKGGDTNSAAAIKKELMTLVAPTPTPSPADLSQADDSSSLEAATNAASDLELPDETTDKTEPLKIGRFTVIPQ